MLLGRKTSKTMDAVEKKFLPPLAVQNVQKTSVLRLTGVVDVTNEPTSLLNHLVVFCSLALYII